MGGAPLRSSPHVLTVRFHLPRPSQIFWAQNKHLTLELIKRIADRRERKPERAIRDAVEGLRADLPSKLRKHENIAVAGLLDYVDERDPFPLVHVASQEQRRVCRWTPRRQSSRGNQFVSRCDSCSELARRSSCCSLGSVRTWT